MESEFLNPERALRNNHINTIARKPSVKVETAATACCVTIMSFGMTRLFIGSIDWPKSVMVNANWTKTVTIKAPVRIRFLPLT